MRGLIVVFWRAGLRIHEALALTELGITSIYLQGIDSAEIIDTVHARRAPAVPVNSTLRP